MAWDKYIEQKAKRPAIEYPDPVKHKKKAKAHTPKKANHKHEYEDVILRYNIQLYDQRVETRCLAGSRCKICGIKKVGFTERPKWHPFGSRETLDKIYPELPVLFVEDLFHLNNN